MKSEVSKETLHFFKQLLKGLVSNQYEVEEQKQESDLNVTTFCCMN